MRSRKGSALVALAVGGALALAPAAATAEEPGSRPTRSGSKPGQLQSWPRGLRRDRGARRRLDRDRGHRCAGRQAAAQGRRRRAQAQQARRDRRSSSTRACSATTAATTTTALLGRHLRRPRRQRQRSARRSTRSCASWPATQPNIVKARGHRPHDQRRADPGAARSRATRATARRRAPGGPLHSTSTRASGSRPSRTAASRTTSSTTTARTRAGDGTTTVSDRWSTPTSCGSSSVANPDGYDFTFTPGQPPVAQEPARQQRRRPDHQRRRRRPQPQLRPRSGTTTTRAPRRTRPRRPTAAPARPPSPRRRPWTGCRSGSSSSSRSTTTRPPSCCCTRSAGRWRRRRPTTRSSWRCRAPTTTRPSTARGARRADDYDPDLSAELYTTNGETNDHGYSRYKTLGWTPEMDVSDPARGGGAVGASCSRTRRPTCRTRSTRTCRSRSTWPSPPRTRPTRSSDLGIQVPDFVPTTFAVSYGDPQTVEVNAKRELGKVTRALPDQRRRGEAAATTEWKGGERYGGEGVYFHRLRGEVSGAKPGDNVKVWFESLQGGKRSEAFTYDASPTRPTACWSCRPRTTPAAERPAYPGTAGAVLPRAVQGGAGGRQRLRRLRRRRQGPHGAGPLGVLSHYKAVVWYTGDDLFIREPGAPGRPARRSSPTTRSSTSAPTSTRAASCSTRARTPPGRSSTAVPLQPAGQPPYCKATATSAGTVNQLRAAEQRLPPVLPGGVRAPRRRQLKAEASGLPLLVAGGPFGTRSSRSTAATRPTTRTTRTRW